jgi:hypothetical protein
MPVLSAPAEDVDALLKRGVEFRRHGQDREALAVFQQALAIKRLPRIVGQIAFAEQALGDWLSAQTHLEEALARAEDPWIQKNRATLEQALRSVGAHIGRVDVWGTPAGAEVLLDGATVGTLPLAHPIRVTESQVTLQVRATGHVEITRVLHIPLGDLVRERVDLHTPPAGVAPTVAGAPSAEPTRTQGRAAVTTSPPPGKTTLPVLTPPANSAAAATAAPGLALATATGSESTAPEHERQPVYRRWWFWTMIGVAAAGAATSVVLLSKKGSSCAPPGCSEWTN